MAARRGGRAEPESRPEVGGWERAPGPSEPGGCRFRDPGIAIVVPGVSLQLGFRAEASGAAPRPGDRAGQLLSPSLQAWVT